MKLCKRCGLIKQLTEFNKTKRSKDGCQVYCRLCNSEIKKEYYLNNRDKVIQKSKEYYNKNKQEIIQKVCKRAKDNKKEVSEYQKQYKENNKSKINHLRRKYQHQKTKASPSWLSKEQLVEIESLYAKSNKLTLETGVEHQVDHIVPLQGKTVCGLHVPWNLQVITRQENLIKSNKL